MSRDSQQVDLLLSQYTIFDDQYFWDNMVIVILEQKGVPAQYACTSFAKRWPVAESEGISEVISAVKRIKRRGPRTKCRGTPRSIGTHLDLEFPETIIWVRSDRHEITNHRNLVSLSVTPKVLHSKLKCHFFKNSYPDPPYPLCSHSPLNYNRLNSYSVSSDPLAIGSKPHMDYLGFEWRFRSLEITITIRIHATGEQYPLDQQFSTCGPRTTRCGHF